LVRRFRLGLAQTGKCRLSRRLLLAGISAGSRRISTIASLNIWPASPSLVIDLPSQAETQLQASVAAIAVNR